MFHQKYGQNFSLMLLAVYLIKTGVDPYCGGGDLHPFFRQIFIKSTLSRVKWFKM